VFPLGLPLRHRRHSPRTPFPANVRVADDTLGAHGVASSSHSAPPAHFVGGVLNAVAPRIAQHVIEIRSAHRYFGARQVRSHFGRNAPQLRIEPQAGFPATQEPLSPEAPLGTVARPLRTFCGSRSPDWRPPPLRLPAIVQTFRERGQRGAGANSTRFALTHPAKSSTCSPASRASSASLIFRPSPRPLEAPLAAQLRLSKAEADATCEHQRNRAGEAVLPGLNLGAGICFETQFRIPYVLRE
jgi:hypothetical protein